MMYKKNGSRVNTRGPPVSDVLQLLFCILPSNIYYCQFLHISFLHGLFLTTGTRTIKYLLLSILHIQLSRGLSIFFFYITQVSLLSELNCCATPCLHSNNCYLCHSKNLAERDIISFCGANYVPKPKQPPVWSIMMEKVMEEVEVERRRKIKMDIHYMLDTMEKSKKELNELGYSLLLGPNILYDYRAIFMKIYNRDTIGHHLCPKKPHI